MNISKGTARREIQLCEHQKGPVRGEGKYNLADVRKERWGGKYNLVNIRKERRGGKYNLVSVRKER